MTRDELVRMQGMLELQLTSLQQQWTQAYGELCAACAMAQPFANMRPPTRNYWTLGDLYNGTIIDDRYLQEPAVELSPASPRYGYIVSQWAGARARLAALNVQILATREQLMAVTYALQDPGLLGMPRGRSEVPY
jgi:hypothetical protein